jgi:hypothetical protein
LQPTAFGRFAPEWKNGADEKARTVTRRQQTLGDQALTSFVDTGLAKQVFPRQLPDGWQARPRLHRILSNPTDQRIDDLLHDRHKGLPVDSQLHE